MVQLLIPKKAETNRRNISGDTPLEIPFERKILGRH